MKDLDIDNKTGENHFGKHPNSPVRLLTARTIINDKIINTAGEDLGKIKDVMINLETHQVEYYVVEFGGFLGLGEKYFAFAPGDFTINTDEHAFVLNRTKQELEAAPGFDKDHWPETNAHTTGTTGGSWGSFMGANSGSEY